MAAWAWPRARRPSAGARTGWCGACLEERPPRPPCFPTQSGLLLLQLQDILRLASEAAELFGLQPVFGEHFLVLLQPLHGLLVRLVGLSVVAQLPVGHGEEELVDDAIVDEDDPAIAGDGRIGIPALPQLHRLVEGRNRSLPVTGAVVGRAQCYPAGPGLRRQCYSFPGQFNGPDRGPQF